MRNTQLLLSIPCSSRNCLGAGHRLAYINRFLTLVIFNGSAAAVRSDMSYSKQGVCVPFSFVIKHSWVFCLFAINLFLRWTDQHHGKILSEVSGSSVLSLRAEGKLTRHSLADWQDLQWLIALVKGSYMLMLLLLKVFPFVSSWGKQKVWNQLLLGLRLVERLWSVCPCEPLQTAMFYGSTFAEFCFMF